MGAPSRGSSSSSNWTAKERVVKLSGAIETGIATDRWFIDREMFYVCGKTLVLEHKGSSRICPKYRYFSFPNTTNGIIVNRGITNSNSGGSEFESSLQSQVDYDQVHYAYPHNVVSDRPDAVIKGIASLGPQTVRLAHPYTIPKNTNISPPCPRMSLIIQKVSSTS
jgi:hypothetical protein